MVRNFQVDSFYEVGGKSILIKEAVDHQAAADYAMKLMPKRKKDRVLWQEVTELGSNRTVLIERKPIRVVAVNKYGEGFTERFRTMEDAEEWKEWAALDGDQVIRIENVTIEA